MVGNWPQSGNIGNTWRGLAMSRRAPKLPATSAAAAPAPQLSLAVEPPPAPETCTLEVTVTLDSWQAVAVAEVLAVPVRLLPRMPAATTLVCRTRGTTLQPARPCAITMLRAAYTAYRTAHVPVFTGDELVALTLAAEHDRASAAVFGEWLDRKVANPGWTLSMREAIGIPGHFEPRGYALGRVLGAYDVDVLAVGVGAEVPEVTP